VPPIDVFERFDQPMALGPELEVDPMRATDVAAIVRWINTMR
jgi:hypothetical protein